MRRSRWLLGLGLLTVLGAMAADTSPAGAWPGYDARRSRAVLVREPRNELIFEGGVAEPLGDLGDGWTEPAGFGARTGYEVGGRYRYFLGSTTAVAPSFHYVDFGNHSSTAVIEGRLRGYEVSTSLFRYGIDVMQYIGAPGGQVQVFVLAGVALVHSRYRDVAQDLGAYATSMDALSFAGGAGLRLGPVELTAVYNVNRPENANLAESFGESGDYDWDYLVVRGGLILTRF